MYQNDTTISLKLKIKLTLLILVSKFNKNKKEKITFFYRKFKKMSTVNRERESTGLSDFIKITQGREDFIQGILHLQRFFPWHPRSGFSEHRTWGRIVGSGLGYEDMCHMDILPREERNIIMQ